jgi:N6-adenosine-specific RNA methylase IME4
VIIERRTTHSTKPVAAYRVIEGMFRGRRLLELFARPPARPGWTAIGLDTTAEAAAFRTGLQNIRRAPDEDTAPAREPGATHHIKSTGE